MFENKTKSPEDVLRRLEELRRWQEAQQKILIEKQNSQRQLLGAEQREIYEKLGFFSPLKSTDDECTAADDGKGRVPGDVSFNEFDLSGITPVDNLNQRHEQSPAKMVQQGVSHGYRENIIHRDEENVAKKPFLRKGQGLSSRFKVNPDSFRLHNLPKYKYANSHRKFLLQPQLPEKLPEKRPDPKKLASTQKPKAVSTVLSAPVVALKPRKYSASHQTSTQLPIVDYSLERSEPEKESDRKATSSNSAPDILDGSDPISWAAVLNPNNIKPISVDRLRQIIENPNGSSVCSFEDDDLDNLSLFELLEKKAQDGSILLDSSILQRWVKNARSQPPPEENSFIDLDSIKNTRVSPLPCDIENKIVIDDSDAATTSSDDEDGARYGPEKGRVRFSDDIIVNQFDNDSDTETVLSNEISSIDLSKMSTPNVKLDFETIRAQLFAENTTLTDDDELSNTLTNSNSVVPHKAKLIEKTDLLKSRLASLEKEIADFQKHNSELIKLKQDCQLEKIRFGQERIELGEKLHDERIKMEIELHDERMRVENEKKKYEKLIKDQRTPNRKEREEITKLKAKIDELQKENRDKDSKHTAAQTRLRAQIRNLEKDLKEFSFEIDNLKKEKKRLESENAKMMRSNNNKMLQEINKSIAKLVPKVVPSVSEIKNQNTKPVVARVTSHTSAASGQRSNTKIISNTRQNENNSSESSTHDESSADEIEENRSSYFKQKRKPTSTGEENVDDERNDEINPPEQESNTGRFPAQDEFKREIENPDGSKDIWYTNGNLKKISADGMLIRMLYYNKDIKETNIDEGTVKYYYAETNTWHTTYLDGLEILEFPNGQTEHRYKDGTVEVHFENGSIRISNPTDPVKAEEWRYPDGTNLIEMKSGDKILLMPNGQKEVHTKIHKRREYPDGTVKIVYPDGSQETRYSNGRIRLKDKDGNLVMDSEQI